jgi:hypothetical protein
MIFLNLFLAILLENFEDDGSEDEKPIDSQQLAISQELKTVIFANGGPGPNLSDINDPI